MYNSVAGIEVLFERTTTTCANSVPTKEIVENSSFTIYPNPTSGTLNLKIPEVLNQEMQLLVFDLHGRLLIKKAVEEGVSMDISSLKSGMYLLGISSSARTVYKQFVVK